MAIEAIKRGNKIINNILAKHKNPNFSKDLEMKLMMIVLNFFNIFLLYRKVRLWLLSKRKIAHIKVGRANR